MTDKEKQIEALLEKASENISAARLDHGEYDQLNNASEKIWKVLALLKSEQCPKNIDTFCEKCGKVFVSSDDNTGTLCPDCQSQEPDAEFVSELTKRIRSNFEPTRFGPKGFPQIMFKEMIKPDVMEACDRIEAAEKNVQIWREACDLEAKGREVAEKELLIMTNNRNHFEKQVEQLTAKLDAEGFRFREQKQISKELQAKLAEAKKVSQGPEE